MLVSDLPCGSPDGLQSFSESVDFNKADRKLCVKVTLTSAVINLLYNLSLWRGGKREYIINLF